MVEDDPDLADDLVHILGAEGYAVSAAMSGEKALRAVGQGRFDVILLDLNLPDTDGFTLCARFRANPALDATSIIALTARSHFDERIQGLRRGFDEYLTKPFRVAELKARVAASLRQSRRERDLNPLTLLPGNAAIERFLVREIASGRDFAVCYADIDRFKGYNDRYGFAGGDTVIRALAGAIQMALVETGDGFAGHVGGDDFVVALANPDHAQPFCDRLLVAFDDIIRASHTPADLARGGFEAVDRNGDIVETPLMALSIAVVAQRDGRYSHVGEISRAAAELKGYLKRHGGGSLMERRRGAAAGADRPLAEPAGSRG